MPFKGDTFISLFDKARKSHADQECYISYDGNMERRSIAFKDLWTLASRFAHNLKEIGLQRGDYVVIASPLSLEYIVAGFGVIFAGGVVVSMEKLFPKCEMLKETIKMTEAKFMLLTQSTENDTWPFFKPKSTKKFGQNQFVGYEDESLPSLKKIIFTNKSTDANDSQGFLNHLRMCKTEFQDYDLDPENSCVTTCSLNPGVATPKLIELSHRALVNTARLWRRVADLGKVHFWFPWFIGITLPYDALNGTPRVITDTYVKLAVKHPEHHKNVIELEGLQSSIMSPPDIKGLADLCQGQGQSKGQGGERIVKHVMSGGQPITKEIFEVAQKMSNHIYIVYFLSECNIVSCNYIAPGESFTPFDTGYPQEGVEVRILDEEFKELPQGKTGRIAIRSPYLFTRYPGQPELSKSVWGDDGWFYSNDAGCLGKDGHLHVFGRRGDVISRGVVLTYPSWIEKPIWKLNDVIEVMVVPVPDGISFQNTCACVVLRPGSSLTEGDIHRMYNESITEDAKDFFTLDYVLIFHGALPKLSRDRLGDLAAQKLGLDQQE